jgi:hypothetical protein
MLEFMLLVPFRLLQTRLVLHPTKLFELRGIGIKLKLTPHSQQELEKERIVFTSSTIEAISSTSCGL